MTCIVGVVDGDDVVLGGDSAGVAGHHLMIGTAPKVFRNGLFVMGYTTSFRMGQLLQYAFTPPDQEIETTVMEYMVTGFIPALRTCLSDGGFAKKDNNVESGGTFLVGYRGRLFEIQDDFQVQEALCGYSVCGCGRDVALGSLHSTRAYSSADMPVRERIFMALEAAQEFGSYVRGPFHHINLNGSGAAAVFG